MTAMRQKLFLEVAAAESKLARARASLAEFDAHPPVGTVVQFNDHGISATYAIRLRMHWNESTNLCVEEPGWLTIFGDGSGSYYADSKGGLSQFWLSDPKEVFRP